MAIRVTRSDWVRLDGNESAGEHRHARYDQLSCHPTRCGDGFFRRGVGSLWRARAQGRVVAAQHHRHLGEGGVLSFYPHGDVVCSGVATTGTEWTVDELSGGHFNLLRIALLTRGEQLEMARRDYADWRPVFPERLVEAGMVGAQI